MSGGRSIKKYIEARDCTIEIYKEFKNEQGFTAQQSVSAAFEESVIAMKSDKREYVAVFLTLAIISLKQGFIPDYIFDRIEKIKEIQLVDLTQFEYRQYQWDLVEIDRLMVTQRVEMDEDSIYSLRVSMLLEE